MKIQLVLTLLSLPLLLVSFQNCESSGTSAGTQANASLATPVTPDPTATPEPQDPPSYCTDDMGLQHIDGSSWQEQSAPKNPALCAGTVEDYLIRAETVTFLCVGTDVVQVGDAFGAIKDVPSCQVPSLSAALDPMRPVTGDGGKIDVMSANLSGVNVTCTETESGNVIANQALAAGSVQVPINFVADTSCSVTGQAADGSRLTSQVDVDIDCGNKIKVGGHCEDFTCKSLVAIAPDASGVIQVPARTGDGLCYAMKMASAIPVSTSSLTTTIDHEVISRNHDVSASNPSATHNPYLMASSLVNFRMAGARTVKVAGSGDSLKPILVDNFVLSGVYPQGSANVDASFYRAFGTSDSTVGATGGVLFNNVVVPVQAFATGGTSTVSPLDLTNSVQTKKVYTLDFRAEDCGGSRNLSDLYLVFQ